MATSTHDKRAVIEGDMEGVIRKMGLQIDPIHSKDTPKRFVKYLEEFNQDPDGIELVDIMKGFERTGNNSMIVQSNIPFVGCCAHHLLPMIGQAYIGYVPGHKILGLSKMTRLVHGVTHQAPSLQEYMGEKIADWMFTGLSSRGAIVVIDSIHCCMAARGVRAINVPTTTSALRGVFEKPEVRAEFLQLIAPHRGK